MEPIDSRKRLQSVHGVTNKTQSYRGIKERFQPQS